MTAVESLPAVVSRDEWFKARKELLTKEKEHTRAGDRLNAERRQLPMVLVDKDYVFEGPNGRKVHLIDLFEGRPQLIMHHVMYGKDWEDMCKGCAGMCDSLHRPRMLHSANTSVVCVSSAPYAKLQGFKDRMDWDFPWYSAYDSDFNDDFMSVLSTVGGGNNGHHGEFPGASTFLRLGDKVYHTYATTGRGVEGIVPNFGYLDITPLGRQEDWEKPQGRTEAAGLKYQTEMRFPDEF